MTTEKQTTQEVKAAFSVGDLVTYTNPQGAIFTGKTVTEIDRSEWALESGAPRYYYAPSDSPWFSVEEICLSLATNPARV